MKLILEITNGQFCGRKISLRSPVQLFVGRTAKADYIIEHDTQLSGVHFELSVEPEGVQLRDLGSTNGTFVNENQIARQELKDGDVIRAGSTSFSITFEEPPIAAALPAAPTGTVETLEDRRPPTSAQDAVPPEPDPTDDAGSVAQPAQPPRGVIASSRPYESAFSDPSPSVVAAALEAAVWTHQVWLLDYCRLQASEVRTDRIAFYKLLATLAEPVDLAIIQQLAQESQLGDDRMVIIGIFGHPALLPYLVENFSNPDKRVGVAAGIAFQKIVGGDFESEERVTLPPKDGSEPDEFEAEFLDEEKLPDQAKAKAYLEQHGEELSKSVRWSRGLDVGNPLSQELFMQLDLESRWEAALRGVYRKELQLRPQQLLKLRPLYAK